jgi:uncharacterized protein (DUF169 family)
MDVVDARTAGRRMTELLGLHPAPVAVTFAATPPAGIPRVCRPGPAGCAYWKQAGEGAVFYTEAADHFNCPVGPTPASAASATGSTRGWATTSSTSRSRGPGSETSSSASRR